MGWSQWETGPEQGDDRRFCDRRGAVPHGQFVGSSGVSGHLTREYIQLIVTKLRTQERRLLACL